MIIETVKQVAQVSHYVDAGTGSIIIQAVIGAAIAIPILVKTYWRRIKSAVNSRKKQLP